MISWKGHKKPIYSAKFSPCGQYVLTGAGDETLGLWDLKTQAKVLELPGSMFYAPIDWSADGKYIVRGGYGVRCWAVEQLCDADRVWGAELAARSGNGAFGSRTFAESVAFTPDSESVFLHGCTSSAMIRYSVPAGNKLTCGWGGTRESTNLQQFPTGGMAVAPEGGRLATIFGVNSGDRYDSTVILWDVHSGQELGRFPAQPPVPEHATQLTWSPDGKLLAGAYGPVLIVWNIEAAAPVAYIKFGSTHFKGVAFAHGGHRLLAVNTDKTLRVFDVYDWGNCEIIEPKIGKLHAIDVAPNGRTVCIASHLGRIQIFDLGE